MFIFTDDARARDVHGSVSEQYRYSSLYASSKNAISYFTPISINIVCFNVKCPVTDFKSHGNTGEYTVCVCGGGTRGQKGKLRSAYASSPLCDCFVGA
jgi:hypothetical protein